jgi:hypothetical protein
MALNALIALSGPQRDRAFPSGKAGDPGLTCGQPWGQKVEEKKHCSCVFCLARDADS